MVESCVAVEKTSAEGTRAAANVRHRRDWVAIVVSALMAVALLAQFGLLWLFALM